VLQSVDESRHAALSLEGLHVEIGDEIDHSHSARYERDVILSVAVVYPADNSK
jgi:hypothetical protein